MKAFTLLGASALLMCSAWAAPLAKRDGPTDVQILQFALTLEHLENVFYKQGIKKFPESTFVDAGFSKQYYDNLKYIVHDEEAHVELISSALKAAGAAPVAACVYDFPITDVKSFVTLASVLEGVGTSAYLGAAPAIASKDYLTVAGSILVTEALHTSLQRFSLGQVGAANPYATPLGLNEVFSLAAPFIKSCPAGNTALPVQAFPALAATQGTPAAPGITFTFSASGALPSSFFVTFVNGLNVISMTPTMKNGKVEAMIPSEAQGQTYVVLTTKNVTAVRDADVLFGPAIIEVTPPAPTFDLNLQ